MCLQSLIESYWSRDFLLNVSAEALGVSSEVLFITVIVGRILERRELRRWNDAFSALNCHPAMLVFPGWEVVPLERAA
jgi:hypothetical protein